MGTKRLVMDEDAIRRVLYRSHEITEKTRCGRLMLVGITPGVFRSPSGGRFHPEQENVDPGRILDITFYRDDDDYLATAGGTEHDSRTGLDRKIV